MRICDEKLFNQVKKSLNDNSDLLDVLSIKNVTGTDKYCRFYQLYLFKNSFSLMSFGNTGFNDFNNIHIDFNDIEKNSFKESIHHQSSNDFNLRDVLLLGLPAALLSMRGEKYISIITFDFKEVSKKSISFETTSNIPTQDLITYLNSFTL